jgi:uncharacterized protein YecE (DUF72 family)
MRVRTGTSGFSYKEWKGSFYPPTLSDKEMLSYYATHLATVEINNTFYRMPKPEVVAGWAARVPDAFRFVLKAPQRITHRERLVGSEESLGQFLKAAESLGEKLGALLFQLPPFFKRDVPALSAFLALVPDTVRVAFEFRHESWFSDDTYAALREKNVALVGGDADKAERSPPLVASAAFGYLRLRAPEYTDAELSVWANRIFDQPWTEALVFLKHEVRGPEFAQKLSDLTSTPRPIA